MSAKRATLQEYRQGVLSGSRVWVSKAITLVESQLASDTALADALLSSLSAPKEPAIRVGISGSPGVGKSTLIESLGLWLCEQGQRCAVLAIDPSSARGKGSILGDKTRMPRLAQRQDALVRPTASGSTLGGVHLHTREAMLICEAAGFNVVLVETVGVGQSEVWAADLVDSFLLLLLPGAGDELQGIKRGILEVADVIAVNKADQDRVDLARRSALAYQRALSFLLKDEHAPAASVLTCSGQEGRGLPELWNAILDQRARAIASGQWQRRRAAQAETWMWRLLQAKIRKRLQARPKVAQTLQQLRPKLADGSCTPEQAVQGLLAAWDESAGA